MTYRLDGLHKSGYALRRVWSLRSIHTLLHGYDAARYLIVLTIVIISVQTTTMKHD